MEQTDKSLIEAHCRGDATAFGQLMRRYGSSVLGYLMKMSGSPEQAEDFFQETFKRVHEKAHTFRGEKLRPWLFSIATSVAIDGFRRQRKLAYVSLNQIASRPAEDGENLSLAVSAERGSNPYEELVKAEQKEKVKQAIELLP